MKRKITILLIDDHSLVRSAIRILIEQEEDLRVVAEGASGTEVLPLLTKHKPDVVLLDIAMPSLNGIDTVSQIFQKKPQTKILLLSAYSEDGYIQKALSAGVSGYLIKQSSAHVLMTAIREVHSGGRYFSPFIEDRILTRGFTDYGKSEHLKTYNSLSVREKQVLQRVAEGAGNKEIATQLEISVKTVEKHRQKLMNKLDIHDVAGLTRYAIAEGLIEVGT